MLRLLTGPVFRVSGARSRNTPGWITLGMGETYPAAVLAQERFEQAWYRLAMLLIGLPLGALLIWCWSHLWMLAPVLIVLSAALCHVPPFRRWRELRGTAIDIALATSLGADLDAYETGKARSRTSYPQFDGWTEAAIKAELIKLRLWAVRNVAAWA